MLMCFFFFLLEKVCLEEVDKLRFKSVVRNIYMVLYRIYVVFRSVFFLFLRSIEIF